MANTRQVFAVLIGGGGMGVLAVGGIFPLQSWVGYVGRALVFVWNGAMRGNFTLYFSAVFCWCVGDWAVGYNAMNF